MRLADMFPAAAVVVPLRATEADGAITELGTALALAHGLSPEVVIERLRERERLGPTSVGDGVAMPHGRDDLPRTVGALGISRRAIAWDAPDGAPVRVVVAILSPRDGGEHLASLAAVSRRLSEHAVRDALTHALTRDEARSRFVDEPARD